MYIQTKTHAFINVTRREMSQKGQGHSQHHRYPTHLHVSTRQYRLVNHARGLVVTDQLPGPGPQNTVHTKEHLIRKPERGKNKHAHMHTCTWKM